MKKIRIIVLALLPFIGLQATSATASGIPTVDIAALLQTMKDGIVRAKEFKDKISEAKARLKQLKSSAKDYKAMVEGHYDFETLLNDPSLNAELAKDNWRDVYDDGSNISSLREEFDLYSEDPQQQESFDRELKSYQVQTKFYDLSIERNKKLNNLLDQFSSATTPAAKADLANSIEFESTRIANDAKLMESMNQLMAQERLLRSQKITREKLDQLRDGKFEYHYSSH